MVVATTCPRCKSVLTNPRTVNLSTAFICDNCNVVVEIPNGSLGLEKNIVHNINDLTIERRER